MKQAFLALVLVATALAGCAGTGGDPTGSEEPRLDALSEARFTIRAPEEVWVTASDGVGLHNAVYRPDVPEGEPVPVFINFSPYWGDTAMSGGDPFAQYMVAEYVPRGYAVVLSAIRGTGHSGGCFEIASDRESLDVHEVVDFFASQAWSTGAVAAGGKSYDSTSQNGMVAKFPHPALKGIFHVSGITDMYRYTYKDGVTYTSGPEFTLRYFLTQGLDEYLGATNGAGSTDDEGPDSLGRLVQDLACAELPEHAVSSEGAAATGLKDAYWQERDWNRDIAASAWNGSIFFVHGLEDWNVKPDHVLPWLANLPADVKVLGWLHQWTQDGTGHVYPMRQDWNVTMLRWLDHTLKGRETGMQELWGYESQADDGQWRRSAAWPPAPKADDGEAELASSVEAPLNRAGRYVGTFTATVRASAPAGGVVSLVITDVAPDGTTTWVTEGVRRLDLSQDLTQPEPGATPRTYTFETYPVDHVLAPGHKLDFTWQAMPVYSLVAQPQLDAVTFGDRAVSAPAVLDAEADLVQPQPLPMHCFAC